MAIALPPPATPQLAPLEQVVGQSRDMWLIDYQGITLHVVGDLAIAKDDAARAVARAENISDAVRAIGLAFYRAGYPASLVSYAVANPQELYVRVTLGKVSEVAGPDELTPYFRGLTSDTPLRASQLERARVLADNFSDRAGENVQPQFRLTSTGVADSAVLDLGHAGAGPKPLTIAGDFGNEGNRYAGPYLADLSVRQSDGDGDQVALGGTTSVNAFDISGSGSRPYHEGDLAASRVTRYGIFGIEGRYAAFGQAVQTIKLDGHLSSAAASWTLPLYADFDHRLIAQGRFERSDESVDARAPDTAGLGAVTGLLQTLGLATVPTVRTPVLSELYNSVELDFNGLSRFALGTHTLELNGALALRKGLSDSSHALGGANLSYFLLRPSISLRYGIAPQWDAFGDTHFQIGNSAVPQLEQFVIGGPGSLHAYEAGVGVGDHGEDAHLGVEWHGLDGSWAARYRLRPRLFVEYGATRLERAALDDSAGRVKAADVGLGLEGRPIPALTASVSVSQSIYSSGDEEGPAESFRQYVFFQIAGRF